MAAEAPSSEPKPEPAAAQKEPETPKSPDTKPAAAEKKEAEAKPAQKEPEKTVAEKKEPEKAPPKVDPFKDFPKAVSIPVLSDNDPAGEASKAPKDLGPIHGTADVNWQLILVGGDRFLKGGRKYVLARTEQDAAKAQWVVQLAEGGSDKGGENLARLWRDGEILKFQWDAKAPGAQANYLRNCMLQVRVGGDGRHLALTEPIKAEPVVLDLMRGQASSNVAIKWAPGEELLRFRFEKPQEFEKAVFQPADPVPPKTEVFLNFVYTDRNKNDTNAVSFRITPRFTRSSLSLDVRLHPETASRTFKMLVGNSNEQQLGVAIDRLGNSVEELERRWNTQQGEDAQKTAREIEGLSARMWSLQFFLKAHKKLAIHYQVVTDLGGQELVLVTTK